MKPAIVIVHGAWHVPEHYMPFTEELRRRGFEVLIPHLPCSGAQAQQSVLNDDVNVISGVLKELDRESRKAIVVAHSYGGAVATQALEGYLGPDRQKKNLLHLIFMCAFMLQPGESTFSASQPRPDPDPVSPHEDGTCFLNQSPKNLFYDDVEHNLARKSEELLQRHSLAALAEPINFPAWRYIPTTYLKCTQDNVLFPDWQDKLIKAVQDSGVSIDIETFEASHSPYLSRTLQMVEVVERITRRCGLSD